MTAKCYIVGTDPSRLPRNRDYVPSTTSKAVSCAGDIQLPEPPAIGEGPPPELASRDGGGEASGVSGTSLGHVDPDLTGENSPANAYHDDSSPSYDNGGGFDDGGYSGGYEDGGFDVA